MAADTSSSGKYQSLMTDRGLLASLMEAAANGRAEELRSVMQKIEERYADHCKEGGDGAREKLMLGFKDGHGRTVAHFAALGCSTEVLELVIQRCPAAVQARDNSGKTPLFTSASLGDLASIKLLLSKGAQVDAESEGGSTPLHEAVYAEKAAAVEALLSNGANVNKVSSLGTPVQIAAVTLQKEVLELLLKAGANPCTPAEGSSTTSPFPPALILAASKGASEIVDLLLKAGADPDCVDSEGFTPLHCAAEADSPTCAKLLLDSGADWGMPARDGTTPLDMARRHNSTAVVKQLEPLGINPNPKRPPMWPAPVEASQSASTSDSPGAASTPERVTITLEANAPLPKQAMVIVEKLKNEGNTAFRQDKFSIAKEKYSQAIDACPLAEAAREVLGVLYSNRSFANENLKDAQGALQDAQAATQLRPEWSKAHYRLGRAHRLAGDTEEYIAELWQALRLDQSNAQIREEMDAAIQEARASNATNRGSGAT